MFILEYHDTIRAVLLFFLIKHDWRALGVVMLFISSWTRHDLSVSAVN